MPAKLYFNKFYVDDIYEYIFSDIITYMRVHVYSRTKTVRKCVLQKPFSSGNKYFSDLVAGGEPRNASVKKHSLQYGRTQYLLQLLVEHRSVLRQSEEYFSSLALRLEIIKIWLIENILITKWIKYIQKGKKK